MSMTANDLKRFEAHLAKRMEGTANFLSVEKVRAHALDGLETVISDSVKRDAETKLKLSTATPEEIEDDVELRYYYPKKKKEIEKSNSTARLEIARRRVDHLVFYMFRTENRKFRDKESIRTIILEEAEKVVDEIVEDTRKQMMFDRSEFLGFVEWWLKRTYGVTEFSAERWLEAGDEHNLDEYVHQIMPEEKRRYRADYVGGGNYMLVDKFNLYRSRNDEKVRKIFEGMTTEEVENLVIFANSDRYDPAEVTVDVMHPRHPLSIEKLERKAADTTGRIYNTTYMRMVMHDKSVEDELFLIYMDMISKLVRAISKYVTDGCELVTKRDRIYFEDDGLNALEMSLVMKNEDKELKRFHCRAIPVQGTYVRFHYRYIATLKNV
jgi:hypothetical protein